MRMLVLFLAFATVLPAFAQAAPAAPAAPPASASASDAATAAKRRTEALIGTFKKVKKGGEKENAAAFRELDGFLAFDALIEGALASRADRFTPAQRREFESTFRTLLREIAYPNSGRFFTDAQVKIAGAQAQGDVAVVKLDAYVPAEDLETEVGVHWKEIDGALRIVDVSFDGDSLVLDYRNQFAAIIDAEGVDGLLRKVKQRLEEVRKGGAAKPKE